MYDFPGKYNFNFALSKLMQEEGKNPTETK